VESSPTPSRRGGGQTVLIDRGRSRRPRSPGLRPSPLLLLPRPLILSSSLPAGQVVQRFFAHLQDQVPTHLHSLQPPHASLALFVALHPLSFNTDLTMLTTTTSLALLAVAGTAANAAGIVDNLQLFSKLTVSLSCPLNRARGRTTTPPRPRPLRAAGACSRGGSASLSTLQMDSSALGEADEHPVGASGRAQGGGVGGRRSRSAAPNNNEAVLRRRAFKHLVLTRRLPHRAEPRRYELLGRVQGPERRDRRLPPVRPVRLVLLLLLAVSLSLAMRSTLTLDDVPPPRAARATRPTSSRPRRPTRSRSATTRRTARAARAGTRGPAPTSRA